MICIIMIKNRLFFHSGKAHNRPVNPNRCRRLWMLIIAFVHWLFTWLFCPLPRSLLLALIFNSPLQTCEMKNNMTSMRFTQASPTVLVPVLWKNVCYDCSDVRSNVYLRQTCQLYLIPRAHSDSLRQNTHKYWFDRSALRSWFEYSMHMVVNMHLRDMLV